MAAKAADIPAYPGSIGVTMGLRSLLHPLFKALAPRVSEHTFANLYLFRDTHAYRLSRFEDSLLVSGRAKEGSFFMLPFGLPGPEKLKRLFSDFAFLKNATEDEAGALESMGFTAREDRDNFDYVYSTEELAGLKGRKYHAKKNLVNAFLARYECAFAPISKATAEDALSVLDEWRRLSPVKGDYDAAAEAIGKAAGLKLTGTVYYVRSSPVAYVLGEELSPDTFVLHFEKGVGGLKGLMQYVNSSLASMLRERYRYLNMEQDLGDEGLRRSKESYRPFFVKKFTVRPSP